MTKSNYVNNIKYTDPSIEKNELNEDICIKEKEEDKTIGNKCSIDLAINNNLYNEKNNSFDFSIISKDDINKIDLHKKQDIGKEKNYKYSLCNSKGEPNCALKNKNIWLTKNNNNQCEIYDKIALGPWKTSIETGSTDGIKKLKKPDNHEIIIKLLSSYNKDNPDICDERWYDWFTIPDYHNGNNYSSQLSLSKQKNICYKPCNFGSIPINEKDNENNITKCINRDLIDNGRLKNTFPHTPYSMIILLGSTKEDLIELYQSEFTLVDNIIEKYNKRIEKDYDYEINNDILTQINEKDTSELIFNSIHNDIKKSIMNIITEPISHLNIIPPIDNRNELNYNPERVYNNKFILIKAYNISKKLSDFLTYDNLSDKFYNWKKELSIINNLDINSWEFNKLLLLLQACCKSCFGFQNKDDIKYKHFKSYNDYIISNITKYNRNDKIYNRLQYPNYNKEQVLKSIDTNNSFNNFNQKDLNDINLNKIKDYQLNENAKVEDSSMPGFKSLNKCDINFKNHKGDIIKDISECNINKTTNLININILDNTFSSNIIVYINFFLLSLLMIIYLFLSYNLIILTWKQFSNVINYILMGIIWIIATFISIFTTLFGNADNKKGIIINIHKNALKAEWYYGYFTQSLAIANAKRNYLFNGVLLLGTIFVFLTIIKTFSDIFNIFKK